MFDAEGEEEEEEVEKIEKLINQGAKEYIVSRSSVAIDIVMPTAETHTTRSIFRFTHLLE